MTFTQILGTLVGRQIEISLKTSVAQTTSPIPTPDKRGLMMITGPLSLNGELVSVGNNDNEPCCIKAEKEGRTSSVYFKPCDLLLAVDMGEIVVVRPKPQLVS